MPAPCKLTRSISCSRWMMAASWEPCAVVTRRSCFSISPREGDEPRRSRTFRTYVSAARGVDWLSPGARRRVLQKIRRIFRRPLDFLPAAAVKPTEHTITSMTLSAHHLSPIARPSLGWPRDCARSEATRKHQAMPINTRHSEGLFTPAYVAPLEVGMT